MVLLNTLLSPDISYKLELHPEVLFFSGLEQFGSFLGMEQLYTFTPSTGWELTPAVGVHYSMWEFTIPGFHGDMTGLTWLPWVCWAAKHLESGQGHQEMDPFLF